MMPSLRVRVVLTGSAVLDACCDEVVCAACVVVLAVLVTSRRDASAAAARSSGESAGIVGLFPGLVGTAVLVSTALTLLILATGAAELFVLLCAPPLLVTLPVSDEVAARREPPVAFEEECEPVPVLVDPLSAEEALALEPEGDDPVDPSAQATPQPAEKTAAPTPRATANPPTRPTNLEAPMFSLLLRTGVRDLSGG